MEVVLIMTGATMRLIKCNFTTQSLVDNPEMQEILRIGGDTVKFWALYGECHLTFQSFKSLCIKYGKGLYFESIEDLAGLCWSTSPLNWTSYEDSNKFASDYWDYFNPNTRRKIKLEFAGGSHIKSVIYW